MAGPSFRSRAFCTFSATESLPPCVSVAGVQAAKTPTERKNESICFIRTVCAGLETVSTARQRLNAALCAPIEAPVAQLDRALPSEAEGQALNWLRRTGIEVRRFSELAKFGKHT